MKLPLLALAAILLGGCASQPPVTPVAPEVAAQRPVLDVVSEQLQSLDDLGIRVERLDGAVRVTMPGTLAFASDSREVAPAARDALDRIATVLQSAPDTHVRVIGHTDSTGSAPYNQKLSEARAEAVMNYLMDQGVSDDRLEASGLGEEMPVVDNRTAEGRAQNRRVEIEIEG